MEKRLVFFNVSCGVGMHNTCVEDCAGLSEAEIDCRAWELAVDCANSYGQYVDNDYEFDEEDDDGYYCFPDDALNYYHEDYDPEKHDMKRADGGSFMDDIK